MFTRGMCLMFLLALGSFADAADRPNILFCLADDWGWPHAGVFGDPVVKTPTFDRLAKEGVLFEYTFVSSPSCTPSRNATLTGQQFYRLDQGANLHSSLDPKHPNFMFLLRDAGYEIGHWRKSWGPGDFKALGYKENPCGPEFTFPKFLKQRDKTKPFCFWFGTTDPHRPYKKGSGAASGMDIAKVPLPGFYPEDPEIQSDIADYYWEVQRWDRDVASALTLLEEAGELDNTIIAMSGDHGMPFPRCKGNLYDRGVRVPLAIRWGTKVKPGRRLKDFVSFIDLAPTFLDAAGVTIPDIVTGRSLMPLLTATGNGRIDPKRNLMVFGRERHTPAQEIPSLVGYPARAIRTDRWLLILNLEDARWPAGVPKNATHPADIYADCDAGPTKSLLVDHVIDPKYAKFFDLCLAKRPAIELYDCVADPDQVNNLAADPNHAETVQQLRNQLVAYLKATSDPRFTDAPVEFDDYPYRARYLEKHLKERGF